MKKKIHKPFFRGMRQGFVLSGLLLAVTVQAQYAEARFGSFGSATDILSTATMRSNGNLVMIGKSEGLTNINLPPVAAMLAETNPTAGLMSATNFAFRDINTNQLLNTEATDVTESGGYYYVTGKVVNQSTQDEDIFIAKLDPQGGATAVTRIDLDRAPRETGVRILIAGSTVYVTGTINPGGQNFSFMSGSLPLQKTFILGMDINLVNITMATAVEVPNLIVSVEVRDFVYNTNTPSSQPELVLVGYLRGADVSVLDMNLPGGASHISSFAMRFTPGTNAIQSFFVYASFLGGAANNTEALLFESINYQSTGAYQGYLISGQIETSVGTLSGGYFLYTAFLNTGCMLQWENIFSYRSVSAMNQSSFVGYDSHGYDLSGEVSSNSSAYHYYAIGTAYTSTKDIFYVEFDYDFSNMQLFPISSYLYNASGDEEGRSVYVDPSATTGSPFLTAGFSNSFNSGSPADPDFLFVSAHRYMQGCHINSERINDIRQQTMMVNVPICDPINPGTVCLYAPPVIPANMPYIHGDTDKELICENTGSIFRQAVNTSPANPLPEVFPVPATGEITLRGLAAMQEFEMLAVNGQVVLTGTVSPGKAGIDLSGLPAGVYVLALHDTSGIPVRLRVIKN